MSLFQYDAIIIIITIIIIVVVVVIIITIIIVFTKTRYHSYCKKNPESSSLN